MSKGNSILGIYLGFTDKIGSLRNWREVKGKRTANHFQWNGGLTYIGLLTSFEVQKLSFVKTQRCLSPCTMSGFPGGTEVKNLPANKKMQV